MTAVFRLIDNVRGRIEVPHLGALIGNIQSGNLVRRGDSGPESDFYDFKGVCAWVTAAMFDDPDYPKRVVVQTSRTRSYILEPQEGPGQRTVLTGRSLVMDRVKLVALT